MKMRVLAIAIIVLFIGSAPAFAHHRQHDMAGQQLLGPGLVHMMRSAHHHRARHRPKFIHGVHRYRAEPDFMLAINSGMRRALRSIEPHPAGCPHTAFCGCGTSVRVFGHPVRDLYLAANWFRFPRAMPAPGTVAVRRHHVFYIESVNGDGTVLAYDPNSGNHMTRVHTVSLAGYVVVRPN